MKIEIDLSNKPELRRQKAELTRYLDLINLALKEDEISPSQENARSGSDDGSIFDSLPINFSSSDIYKLADGKMSRSAAKLLIGSAIADGKIEELSRGVGRKPSQYKKI